MITRAVATLLVCVLAPSGAVPAEDNGLTFCKAECPGEEFKTCTAVAGSDKCAVCHDGSLFTAECDECVKTQAPSCATCYDCVVDHFQNVVETAEQAPAEEEASSPAPEAPAPEPAPSEEPPTDKLPFCSDECPREEFKTCTAVAGSDKCPVCHDGSLFTPRCDICVKTHRPECATCYDCVVDHFAPENQPARIFCPEGQCQLRTATPEGYSGPNRKLYKCVLFEDGEVASAQQAASYTEGVQPESVLQKYEERGFTERECDEAEGATFRAYQEQLEAADQQKREGIDKEISARHALKEKAAQGEANDAAPNELRSKKLAAARNLRAGSASA